MLLTGEDILSRFEKLIERATHIRIATAWATPGSALNELEAAVEKKGLEVRTIVGIHGNATDPSALERLRKLGNLRLAGNEALFHPKVYIFEFENGTGRAWVGSANFTGPGFENRNVETVYETKDIKLFLGWFEQQWGQSQRANRKTIDNYRKRRENDPPDRTFLEFIGEPEGAVPGPSLLPEAQDWKSVLKRSEIRSAFNRMRKILISGSEKLRDRGGKDPKSMYWRADLEYWCAFRDPDDRRKRGKQGYWNSFGLGKSKKSDQTLFDIDLARIDLEINPPLDGHHQYAGHCAGLFVRNDRGDVFLARNLNRIPGVNSEDLERRLNERLPGRIVDVPWRNRTRRMVVLSEVGSGELRKTVAELVKLVAELRDAAGG